MKIGELAILAKCPKETIRYYEKTGLMPKPERTTGNYREYGPKHLGRLRFIRNCRALDMTHDEIRRLLDLIDDKAEDCGPVNNLLDEHIGHVEARIEELTQLQHQLCELRKLCKKGRAVESCKILRELKTMDPGGMEKRKTHLG